MLYLVGVEQRSKNWKEITFLIVLIALKYKFLKTISSTYFAVSF